jgi:hypothetical protein
MPKVVTRTRLSVVRKLAVLSQNKARFENFWALLVAKFEQQKCKETQFVVCNNGNVQYWNYVRFILWLPYKGDSMAANIHQNC